MANASAARKMTEQEIVASFDDAINYEHIYVVYQLKINHVTGRMIGAEALMRMRHPVYGIQMLLAKGDKKTLLSELGTLDKIDFMFNATIDAVGKIVDDLPIVFVK